MIASSRFWPWAVVAGLFGILALLGLVSDGVYQNDGLTHFVIARNAWRAPANFFDAWGRPGCTTPLALVAACGSPETGMMLARLLNAAMAAVVAGRPLPGTAALGASSATARRRAMEDESEKLVQLITDQIVQMAGQEG